MGVGPGHVLRNLRILEEFMSLQGETHDCQVGSLGLAKAPGSGSRVELEPNQSWLLGHP